MLDLFPSNLRELDLSFNSLEGIGENAVLPLVSLTELNLQEGFPRNEESAPLIQKH